MSFSYYGGETESIGDNIKFLSQIFQILICNIICDNNCNRDWHQYIHMIAMKSSNQRAFPPTNDHSKFMAVPGCVFQE